MALAKVGGLNWLPKIGVKYLLFRYVSEIVILPAKYGLYTRFLHLFQIASVYFYELPPTGLRVGYVWEFETAVSSSIRKVGKK